MELLKENDIELYNYPIAMNYRDAYLSMHSKETGKYHGEGINYHNLGVDGLEEALNKLTRPIKIIKSKKRGKIELILESYDKEGRSILSIVAINTHTLNSNKFEKAHIITSVYGRRNANNYINLAEKEGRLITKKEESTQGIPQVQYEGNINENSSKNSIPNSSENVNTNNKNNSSGQGKALLINDAMMKIACIYQWH